MWSWSHTQEAYDDLQTNISNLSREELEEIASEVLTYKFAVESDQLRRKLLPDDDEGEADYTFNPNNWYDEAFYKDACESNFIKTAEPSTLTEIVWDFAQERRDCTNGGHHAYICPYSCHQLPFDLIKQPPVLTASHIHMLTHEHMNHEQYQLITEPAVIMDILKHLNRYELLDSAAILYVVTHDNSKFMDTFDSEIVEAWYCGDRHPAFSTAVHCAYRKEQ